MKAKKKAVFSVPVTRYADGRTKDILKGLGADRTREMYRTMRRIREFEERIRFLFLEGKMPGTVHQYIGQEACAAGVCAALLDGDVIASTHRPHGHAIARGITTKALMAELYGKSAGCCRGKGGSMHVGDLEKGMLPAIAIVGGNIPIVAGMALAFKMRKEKRVAVSFFGDGASNEGAFHEGINMAAIYDVPAVFVCENNLYAASTSISRVMKKTEIKDRANVYGIDSAAADGMDVLDVYAAAEHAIGRARKGGGPFLLELKTFRLCGHSRRDANAYMTDEEKEYWKARDPIPYFENVLEKNGMMDRGEMESIGKELEKEVSEAIEFGQSQPDPTEEELFENLYVTGEVPS